MGLWKPLETRKVLGGSIPHLLTYIQTEGRIRWLTSQRIDQRLQGPGVLRNKLPHPTFRGSCQVGYSDLALLRWLDKKTQTNAKKLLVVKHFVILIPWFVESIKTTRSPKQTKGYFSPTSNIDTKNDEPWKMYLLSNMAILCNQCFQGVITWPPWKSDHIRSLFGSWMHDFEQVKWRKPGFVISLLLGNPSQTLVTSWLVVA